MGRSFIHIAFPPNRLPCTRNLSVFCCFPTELHVGALAGSVKQLDWEKEDNDNHVPRTHGIMAYCRMYKEMTQ